MTKFTTALLLVTLLMSALLGSGMLTRGHVWGDDFAAYLMQAKSILTGEMDEFVAHNAFTVTQSSHQIGPVAYPWGFPLMLAPVYAALGLSPLALKLPGLLTFLGFLFTFFIIMKRRFVAADSLIAIALFAFHPGLLLFLDNILSDIPFLFFSMQSLLLADIYLRNEQPQRSPALAAGWGVAIFIAAFVRTQGFVLLGGALLYLGIRFLHERARRKEILRDGAILLAIFGALWGISILVFPGGQGSYLELYAGFGPGTLTANMAGYSRLFGQYFESLPVSNLMFIVSIFLFAIGLVTHFKAELFLVLYAGLYLAVLWSWPEWQGFRFIFPMLPLFILFAWHGMGTLLGLFPSTWRRAGYMLVRGVLILAAAVFLWNAGSNAVANLQEDRAINGPFDPYSIELYEFIKNKTSPKSVIVFFKPRALRLMTGRDTLASTECERMALGDFIALSRKVGENLQIPPEQIDTCGLPLESVFQNRRFVVYRVLESLP